MTRDSLQALRRTLASLEPAGAAQASDSFSFGFAEIDTVCGGLPCGALHEIYAHSARDAVAAAGFAAALAVRVGRARPLVWVREDNVDRQAGGLSASGLAELGLDPGRLVLVRARDAKGVLRAGAEALRCGALGAVLIEPWGEPAAIDLVATRRLALAASASGVAALMLRPAARPVPSAATSRWCVRGMPSRALEAGAPGWPAFAISLLRRRGGAAGFEWRVEWNRDAGCFETARPAPLSGAVGAVPADRPAAQTLPLRRTG